MSGIWSRGLARKEPHTLPGNNEPAAVAIRQWLQNHRIDYCENGRARSDAKRERQNRCQGESGALPQSSKGVPEILNEYVPCIPAPHFAYLLFQQNEIAKSAAGGVACFLGRQAVLPLLGGLQFEVR